MNFFCAALLSAASLFPAAAQSPAARVEPDDLQRLAGALWTGALTCLGYLSGLPVSIPSQLVVTREDGSSWTFEYLHPMEFDEAAGRHVGGGISSRAC